MLCFFTLLTLSIVQARPVDKRASSTDSGFQDTLQTSGALAAMVPLLLMHHNLRRSGFKLSRSLLASTDLLIWLLLGFSATIWTTFVFLSAYVYQDKPCTTADKSACLGRLAYVPWMLVTAFCFWLGGLVTFEKLWLGRLATFIGFKKPYSQRELDITIYVTDYFPVVVLGPILLTTIGAFKDGQYTISVLNIVGVMIFLYGVRGIDAYRDSPHVYDAHYIRIPLTTDLDPGIVYILPSEKYWFGAIYSPRIESEHLALDEFKKDLEQFELKEKEDPKEKKDPKEYKLSWIRKCRSAMRNVIVKHNKNVAPLSRKELNYLAGWLCGNPKRQPNKFRQILAWLCCKPQPQAQPHHHSVKYLPTANANLIGRELIMALLHCESLVSKMSLILDTELQDEILKLRPVEHGEPDLVKMSGSDEKPKGIHHRESNVVVLSKARSAEADSLGMSGETKKPSVNVAEGEQVDDLGGFLTAARSVYKIFNEECPKRETFTKGKPPNRSIVFEEVPDKMDSYVKDLWKICYDIDPSTFGALYLWCSVWYKDMGNSNGYHITPLKPDPNHYPLSSWLIRWRGTWFTCILSQLLTMLPTILSSFLGTAIA
jgi:hypothetical protein